MPTASTLSSIEPDELTTLLAAGEHVRILDVRRAPAFENNPVVLPGALRVPPERLSAWAASALADKSLPVVVYCVHGHEVSQGAAAELRALGFAARFLQGGISAWQAAGGATSAENA